MRILFARHDPIDNLCPAQLHAAIHWLAEGHEVRALDVTDKKASRPPIPTRHVVCRTDGRQADLSLEVPGFVTPAAMGLTFASLSDTQLEAYRDVLRRTLDAEVVAFNPHIIHCDHVWLWGQLALESGVPYVLDAHDEELAAVHDARFHHLAQQAAENAGRILAANDQMVGRLQALFAGLEGRITLLPAGTAATSPQDLEEHAASLLGIYERVLHERFG